MRKDQKKELQRLEDALLEDEEIRQVPEDDTDLLLQEIYGILEEDHTVSEPYTPSPQKITPPPEHYQTYNTDTTDVDLEQFSEALQEKSKGKGCLWSAITVVIGVLLLTIWYLLRILGVSP